MCGNQEVFMRDNIRLINVKCSESPNENTISYRQQKSVADPRAIQGCWVPSPFSALSATAARGAVPVPAAGEKKISESANQAMGFVWRFGVTRENGDDLT